MESGVHHRGKGDGDGSKASTTGTGTVGPEKKTPPRYHPMLRYGSLVALILQTSTHILAMRASRTPAPGKTKDSLFIPSSAVVMSEVLKLIISLVILTYQGNLFMLLREIRTEWRDWLKIAVPSVLYLGQNRMLYVGLENLDVAIFQVTYQMKLITTALFSVFLMGKRITVMQWLSLVILFVGVVIVQDTEVKPHDAANNTNASTKPSMMSSDRSPFIGIMAVICASLTSGFAAIFFEKTLKNSPKSLWYRNVQMAVFGVGLGIAAQYLYEHEPLLKHGYFHGFDSLVWAVILLQSVGGLTVAVVVKYTDNVLKGFACSVAIIVSCTAGMYIFQMVLAPSFAVGAFFVVASIIMYSLFPPDTEYKQPLSNDGDKKKTK